MIHCAKEILRLPLRAAHKLFRDISKLNIRRVKRYCCLKKFLIVIVVIMYLCYDQEDYPDVENRFKEQKLQEALKEDKGTGCNIPKLDPFAEEIILIEKSQIPKIECQGLDWVSCYLSECRVKEVIQNTIEDIKCVYKDIYYSGDSGQSVYSPEVKLYGNETYLLQRSDHVRVKCVGKTKDKGHRASWLGYLVGFRLNAKPEKPPPGRDFSPNIVILCFDSTSHSGFIRRMPKSYEVLTTVLNATLLNGYNIVGDGTPAAIFPILTGRNELQYPDVRISKTRLHVDFMPFIFYNLREDGYRTAYFEDMPKVGTFSYRFNGFKNQPTDHYLRSFMVEEAKEGRPWGSHRGRRFFCVGDTPRYQLMLNITDQFLQLDSKKFCFTFIADITHDNFSLITAADDDVAKFLRNLKNSGKLEDTMFIVMGDHGSRFSGIRSTLTGKLEERLPLMAITLPYSLKTQNLEAQKALEHNRDVLTTPYDIHSTILDVAGLRQHWNDYKVPGADLSRGLTLLKPIPKTRSCSKAGVEAHWCSCLSWKNVSNYDYFYHKAGKALLNHINSLTKPLRRKCVKRTLTSIEWVLRQEHNRKLIKFNEAKDFDSFVFNYNSKVKAYKENFQAKIIVGPGKGVYEASMTYFRDQNIIKVDTRDISRINAYGDEPSCISGTHPHLNMFCFCKK